MPSDEQQIGEACISAYKRLLDECLRFKSAQLYFLKLEVAALSGPGPALEAHSMILEKLAPEYSSPKDYFMERSFVMLIASFEFFLQELVHVIVAAYPEKVGKVEFKLSEVLDAGTTAELVRRGIEATLNSMMYKKPVEYLADVARLLSIAPEPFKANWAVFVEAKARRDLGVHNGWRCNEVYLRKVAEIASAPPHVRNEPLSPLPEDYLDIVQNALTSLASDMMDAVIAKHGSVLSLPRR